VNKLQVTVRVNERGKARLADVISRLKRAGLSNVSCSKRFGLIHGDIEAAKQDALLKVEGVASVRPSQEFKAL
jgi:hypothetical protein